MSNSATGMRDWPLLLCLGAGVRPSSALFPSPMRGVARRGAHALDFARAARVLPGEPHALVLDASCGMRSSAPNARHAASLRLSRSRRPDLLGLVTQAGFCP